MDFKYHNSLNQTLVLDPRQLDAYVGEQNLISDVEDIRENLSSNNSTDIHHEHYEVLKLFYAKDRIDYIFSDLRGLVTTIWILIASVQIVTMQMGFAFFEVGTV